MGNNYTLAIMAGGKSRRMGANKALLKIGQQTIIERIISQTKSIHWNETIIITHTPDDYQFLDLPMFTDEIADSGALGGIYTALCHSKMPYTMVIACDMPFVSDKIIHIMMTHAKNYNAVVPMISGIGQGLHAIYRADCRKIVKAQIQAGQLRVRDFHSQIEVKYLDEEAFAPVDSQTSLMNINTQEDLARARQIVTQIK